MSKESEANSIAALSSDGPQPEHKNEGHKHHRPNLPTDPSRRMFLGQAGGLTAMAVAAGMVPLQPLLGGKESLAEASVAGYDSAARAATSFNYRTTTAQADNINIGVLPDNGDATTFTDFSGNYSKALQHDALGLPNRASWLSLRNALTTGKFSDFESIIVGTPGGGPNSRLNGPQGGVALDLEGFDSHAFNIAPAPSVASAQTAAEEVEHYWSALLRDVPFTEYAGNQTVSQAVQDLNGLSFIKGNANSEIVFPVTPQNLFRGQIVPGDGNVKGPYISQFLLQPTFYGAQALDQKFHVFLPVGAGGSDYLTDPAEFQAVQNGGDTGRQLAFDPTPRHIRMGRDLASFTHVDVLYQAYFTAFLVLSGIHAPRNPGNPYNNSVTEKPFGTLGGPDIAGLLGEVATRALKASWFHKWIVNLRLRPEEYGALVQAAITKSAQITNAPTKPGFPQAAQALNKDVLRSAVLPIIFNTYGSYLMPLAFPEGCPTHPCYPTGHGTVAGACITVLKFLFDGSAKIRPLLLAANSDVVESTTDGNSLQTFTGTDADSLDINGELLKLGFNISTGHGIHAGIHFRSSINASVLLGEQVGLSVLRDRAKSYSEPFTINITKFDGTTATISNP